MEVQRPNIPEFLAPLQTLYRTPSPQGFYQPGTRPKEDYGIRRGQIIPGTSSSPVLPQEILSPPMMHESSYEDRQPRSLLLEELLKRRKKQDEEEKLDKELDKVFDALGHPKQSKALSEKIEELYDLLPRFVAFLGGREYVTFKEQKRKKQSGITLEKQDDER